MKLFKKTWFVVLGFLFLIKPGVVTGIPALGFLDSFYNYVRIGLIVLALFALLGIKIKIDAKLTVMLLIVASEFWKFFATFLVGGKFVEWGAMMNTFGIVLFTYTCLAYSEKSFYNGASIALGTYVVINFATVVLFPGGVYRTAVYDMNFFLSYRTAWLPVYLFSSVVVLMNYIKYRSKLTVAWAIIVMASIFISMILVWTATGLFCFGLALLVYIFCKIFKRGKPINMGIIIAVEAVVFVMLAIIRQQEKFSFILVDLLQKDLTLTERTRIWDNAIQSISKHPLLGIGGVDDEIKTRILGFGATHAHNFYLSAVFQYGFVGLILQLLPILYPVFKKEVRTSKCGLVISCAMIVLLTAYQAECFFSVGYYFAPIYIIIGSLSGRREPEVVSSTVAVERG